MGYELAIENAKLESRRIRGLAESREFQGDKQSLLIAKSLRDRADAIEEDAKKYQSAPKLKKKTAKKTAKKKARKRT